MSRTRMIALAAVMLCSLAALSSSASAVRAIWVQPGGEIKKTVEAFTIRAWGGELTITCELTLTGRLTTAPIEKASAGLLPAGRIGRIEGWAVEGCRTNIGGPAALTVLVEPNAPVNLRYQAFLGVLPNVTGIQFRKLGFAFRIVEPMVLGACLYRGMVDLLLSFPPVEGGGGRFTSERFITPNAIPKTGGALCPEIVEVSGAGKLTPPQIAQLVN
ncbi:MAG TPA: hypothetical protein VFG31_04150 [Conexibacter sp.]|nr:hypothetical protein [Conexibacter sp.]